MTLDIVFWLTACAVLLLLTFILTALTQLRRWRRREQVQRCFKRLCTRYHLTPQDSEQIISGLIALDTEQKKLLVVEHREPACRWFLLRAEQIAGCTLQKSFGRLPPTSRRDGLLRVYTERIELQLELIRQERPLRLLFYEADHNHSRQLPHLEARARYWDHLLSRWSKGQYHQDAVPTPAD